MPERTDTGDRSKDGGARTKVPDDRTAAGGDAGPVGTAGAPPTGTPRSGRPLVMPTRYDGTSDFAEFMAHFQLCIRANAWDDEAAGMFLGLSLEGAALKILPKQAPWQKGGYMDLVQALENRFQPKNQAESHKALFRNRDRRPEEDLLTYADRLEQLVRLGYPGADNGTLNSLAKDRFLDGLRDNQLKYWILYSQPTTLANAVTVGVHAEAHIMKDREGGKTHRINATDTTMAGELGELRREFARELAPLRADFMRELAALRKDMAAAGTVGQGRKPPAEKRGCFLCGKEGHFKRECPLRPAEEAARPAATIESPASPTKENLGNAKRSL